MKTNDLSMLYRDLFISLYKKLINLGNPEINSILEKYLSILKKIDRYGEI